MSEQDDIGQMYHDAGQMREALRRNGLEHAITVGTPAALAVAIAM